MNKPTKADIKRIKEQCEKDHLATTNTGKSQLQIDRQKVLYCGSGLQTRIKGFAVAARIKTCRLEIQILQANIDMWKERHAKLRACTSDSQETAGDRYLLDNAIKQAHAKIISREGAIINALDHVEALCR